MSDKSLSSWIPAYKKALASGELQETYQELVSIVQMLRTEFLKKYKGKYSVANMLHGYIDFTYFYLQNSFLKKHKLKLAIVLNHQKTQFELWLLGQTKEVQISVWEKLNGIEWVDEQQMPQYSVSEIVMLANPDFDNRKYLSESIHHSFALLTREIFEALEARE